MHLIQLVMAFFFSFEKKKKKPQQFQAVFKQFSGGIYGSSDNVVADETELQQHQKLERLFISTRAGKVATLL